MITNFKLFEIRSGFTWKDIQREYKKLRNDSVDENISSKPGRFYWKIHKDSFGIIEASLDKIGAPRSFFYEIKRDIYSDLIGSSTDLEIWYTKDWKTTGKLTWMHKEWSWRDWDHGKKLKGYNDERYKAGYKYMGVVKLSKEERDFFTNAINYNL